MEFITALQFPALTVLLFGVLGFTISLITQRNDIADVMWGPGIFLAVLVSTLANTTSIQPLHYITLTLVGIWAVRLGVRVYLKNAKKAEDARYQRWRESWRYFYLRSYLQVFLLQNVLMLFLASSAITLTTTTPTATSYMYVGVVLWGIGFLFETIGDYQLDVFLKNPENKGKLMRYGLWRYSRHPNYFGEITMWWAIWLITFSSTMSVWTFISPITITILIVFVSGIPLLEKMMRNNPEWEAYKKQTSPLVPWFVKK